MIILSTKDLKLKDKIVAREQQEKRDDFLANRMLILMLAVTFAVVAMLLIKKNNPTYEAVFILHALTWVQIGFGVLLCAAIANFVIKRKNGADESGRYIDSGLLLCAAASFFLMSLFYTKLLTTGCVAFLLAAVILYFIYCFYQRDFFWYTVMTYCGAVLIYLASLRLGGGTVKIIAKIVGKCAAFILPAAVIIAVLVIRGRLGTVSIGGKKRRIMHQGYLYYPFIVCSAVTLAGAVTAFLLPAAMIYAVVALFAVFLIIAIIYTIRMM